MRARCATCWPASPSSKPSRGDAAHRCTRRLADRRISDRRTRRRTRPPTGGGGGAGAIAGRDLRREVRRGARRRSPSKTSRQTDRKGGEEIGFAQRDAGRNGVAMAQPAQQAPRQSDNDGGFPAQSKGGDERRQAAGLIDQRRGAVQQAVGVTPSLPVTFAQVLIQQGRGLAEAAIASRGGSSRRDRSRARGDRSTLPSQWYTTLQRTSTSTRRRGRVARRRSETRPTRRGHTADSRSGRRLSPTRSSLLPHR